MTLRWKVVALANALGLLVIAGAHLLRVDNKQLMFAALNDLRLYSDDTLNDGATAIVAGFSKGGDGGGGTFVYSRAARFRESRGSVIVPSHNTGQWIRIFNGTISPRCFGATGDRMVDDRAAIQLAIDYTEQQGGGAVTIDGRFRITAPLELRRTVDLVGVSTARSANWGAGRTSGSEIFNDGVGTAINIKDAGGYRNRVERIWISGNKNSSHAIDIENVYDGIVRDCVISSHGGNGINASAAASWEISGNLIHACHHGLKTGADTNGWFINHNHVQSCRAYGAWVDSAWGTSIIGNTIEGNKLRDLYLRTPGGVSVCGNYFEGESPEKVYIDNDVNGVSIVGNFINGSGGAGTGIVIADSKQKISAVSISNNWFRNLNAGVAIVAEGGLDNVVMGPNYFGEGRKEETQIRYVVRGSGRGVRVNDQDASPWRPFTPVARGEACRSAGRNVYLCVVAGETGSMEIAGTGTVQDGSVVWKYIGEW